MDEPINVLQILEIAAGIGSSHGILINIPPGHVQDGTRYSTYKSEDSADSNRAKLNSIYLNLPKWIEPEEEDCEQTDVEQNHGKDMQNDSEDDRASKHVSDNQLHHRRPSGWISYKTLLQRVQAEAPVVEALMAMHRTDIVLLYTDNDADGIHWFWTIICAGGVPCLCTKLPEDPVQRTKQIVNLKETLKEPLILTSKNLEAQFKDLDVDGLKLWTFGQIDKSRRRILPHRPYPGMGPGNFHGFEGLSLYFPGHLKRPQSLAVLMLTSGSTGNPKAVCLTHDQIISSLKGKSELHATTSKDVFLNWTALDHVAHLLEIHLHAVYVGANQVTIPTAAVLSNPVAFLERISDYSISYTFAPNFFLGLLVQKFPDFANDLPDVHDFDLSSLRCLISGGEANLVETCVKLTQQLYPFEVPMSCIRPGFGMTETCAGSIYNPFDCPHYDVQQRNQFASLGFGIKGISMRFSESDELEICGPVVFKGYYNNESASRSAFTEDGWFKTGDIGHFDENGRLNLTGRDKDLIIVNGVNHQPQGIENAIDDTNVPSVTPTFTTVFGIRQPGSNTESIVVVYLPEGQSNDASTRVAASASISKAVVTYCGVRPYKIVPLDEGQLKKTSLGKISRSKLQKSFENGDLDKYIQQDAEINSGFMSSMYQPAGTLTEEAVLRVFVERFGAVGHSIGVNHDIFDLGMSSLDILGIKVDLQKSLDVLDIPVTTFFSYPVIVDLAAALDKMPKVSGRQITTEISPDSQDIRKSLFGDEESGKVAYDPVVVLNPNGTKTPIFFIHPGVGEVMIFLNISRYIKDRPVYALRARGFNGEPFHTSFNEIVTTYLAAIRKVQPNGPYSFVGYSFGSIVAFEMTKYLQYIGQEVKFLATIDQPPLFKERAKSYDWFECVLTLAFFLGFMEEKKAYAVLPIMRRHQQHEVLDYIFGQAPAERVQELGMDREKLADWARLALQLKKCISEWDPKGKVKHMDVFYTGPLIGLVEAENMKEWLEEHLMVWSNYVEKGCAKYHEVGGTHRTLISPPHLVGFWKVFKKVMDERGL
ncbi:putative NRPS-like enzyme [Mollisia scopiformis]|uniref:Putative NRPS-like enzyme n=1 Tax=Mollisia scopiformis TaxID=149040 RepID=A0A194XIN5_MOLSC|nr:putative NRPS-like enzyme [Mollisia scopiformis]KUJ20095.1 putative NRPS-like enzyme [Mollisia scopiformis]